MGSEMCIRDRNEPGKAKYWRMKLQVLPEQNYDLEIVQSSKLNELEHYLDKGVEYFVFRPDNYRGSRLRSSWPELVDDVRNSPNIRLIKRFAPNPNVSPGPLIEIYKVD